MRPLRRGQADVVDDIAGGGGTSFLEPLEPEFLRRHRPDIVFYQGQAGSAAAQRFA